MDEILVGIDFGTTNTVVTYFLENKTHILDDGIFKIIPSKLGKIGDIIYCGNYIPINCQNIIHSFKIMDYNTITFNDGIEYLQIELLIIFFRHIYNLIIKKFNLKKIKAVITVPSNFNDTQRETIRTAYVLVGFNIIRIINEPSAAALAYGLNYSSNLEEQILVIDTGGGTMDFTILEKNDLFFEVIHSEGLNDLGGNNFSKLIFDDIIRLNSININNINTNILWNQSHKIKEKLTYLDVYETQIKGLIINDTKIIDYILTRSKFENMSNSLIQKVENILNKIIQQFCAINYIILVGGTSRIPILQEIIKQTTKKNTWLHPKLEYVVAEGAGLYAGIIENKFTLNNDVVLIDVLPLSLGVELADGSYSVIIPKNTPLPIKISQKYTTDSPSEPNIKIKIYQGERKIASKNILIGEYIFDKVSIGGVPIIEISFKVDLNSIINISIIDRKSGSEKYIVIKNNLQMDINDVNKLIEKSHSLMDSDQNELLRVQNIYLIKTHIENSIMNLQFNELFSDESKQIMLEKFKTIEDDLEQMNNLKLIESLNFLQNNYSILGTMISSDNIDQSNNNEFNIEKIILNDKKNELKNRILILLSKNLEWDEYLQPVLKELTYNNTTIDYINEKIELLNQLENEDKDKDKNYKQEVNNLCLYLKSEIELGSINLGINNIVLINLINDTLNLFSNNLDTIDWKKYLDNLNEKCEELYNI
jgi:molecular chaperone DnaK